MSRHSRRVSRPLIAVLLLAVSIIGLSYIYRTNRAGASFKDNASSTSLSMNLAQPTPPHTSEATSVSPIPLTPKVMSPTTQPQLSAGTSMTPNATTQPVNGNATGSIDLLGQAQPAAEKLSQTQAGARFSLVDDADAQFKSGHALEARMRLNTALQSNTLDANQTAAVKDELSQVSQIVVFGRQHFSDDSYGGTYAVQPGDSLAKIAFNHDVTWEFLSRINGLDPRHLRAGSTIKVIQGPFFAVVSTSAFTMDIYLGGLPGEKSALYVTSYPVGLGRDDSTPLGTWMIEPHRKLKNPTYYSPRGEGVIAASDPKNPLGGFWLGLTGTEGQAVGKMSYGIHGTIDQGSIGKQSSMGCIRMGANDIPVVYDLLVEGKSMVVVKP